MTEFAFILKVVLGVLTVFSTSSFISLLVFFIENDNLRSRKTSLEEEKRRLEEAKIPGIVMSSSRRTKSTESAEEEDVCACPIKVGDPRVPEDGEVVLVEGRKSPEEGLVLIPSSLRIPVGATSSRTYDLHDTDMMGERYHYHGLRTHPDFRFASLVLVVSNFKIGEYFPGESRYHPLTKEGVPFPRMDLVRQTYRGARGIYIIANVTAEDAKHNGNMFPVEDGEIVVPLDIAVGLDPRPDSLTAFNGDGAPIRITSVGTFFFGKDMEEKARITVTAEGILEPDFIKFIE